jgi:DNA invertase Pin-like site-specific DNA recombinase
MPRHGGKWISYLRVSTDRQGKSGLGLEAQREAVARYLNGGNRILTDEFVEVESGRRRDRPQLKAALDTCKRLKGRLVVATMSRLTRDPKVLRELQDAGVDMVFCDLPEIPAGPMGRLFLGILAHVNEFEAAQTGERTKLALKAAKARGVKLGGPKVEEAGRLGAAANRARASQWAANVRPIIREIQDAGVVGQRAIARALEARGVSTMRGGRWSAVHVSNILKRLPS